MQALGYKHFFLSLFLGVVREAEKEFPLLQLFFAVMLSVLNDTHHLLFIVQFTIPSFPPT